MSTITSSSNDHQLLDNMTREVNRLIAMLKDNQRCLISSAAVQQMSEVERISLLVKRKHEQQRCEIR